jgi:hypothetical protein
MNCPAFVFLRLAALLAGLLYWVCGSAAAAEVVVEDCTQEELIARIQEALEDVAAPEDGPVIIRFNCDGVITLTNTLVFTNAFLMDGETNDVEEAGGASDDPAPEPIEIVLDATDFDVAISGMSESNAVDGVRLFLVDSGVALTLINLQLINGQSINGGAVYVHSNAFLRATTCVFSNNLALGTGGLNGRSAATNTAIATRGHAGGSATPGTNGWGGAVYNLGSATFAECAFLTNSAAGGNGGQGGQGAAGNTVGGDGGHGARGGSGLGGAIYNRSQIEVTNCSFHLNGALGGHGGAGGGGGDGVFPGLTGRGGGGGAASGGAIFNDRGSRALVINSTFALNVAACGDSAAAGSGRARGRAGAGGPAASGGALANYGSNLLLNCTFFANSAVGGMGAEGGAAETAGGRGGRGGTAWGGSVFNGGPKRRSPKPLLQAIHCTFTDGSAIAGTNGVGGDAVFPGKNGARGVSRGGNVANSNGVFRLQHSLLAYPVAGTNAYGKFTVGRYDYNLVSDRSIKFSRPTTSTNFSAGASTNGLKLGILGRNEGPVETVELMEGSPAINAGLAGTNSIWLDAGFYGITNLPLVFDARGFKRPDGGTNDIGAYESVGQGPPTILTDPTGTNVFVGETITFNVRATGFAPLHYQWYFNDTIPLSGATNTTLTSPSAQTGSAGSYRAVVTNAFGSVTSAPAVLTVTDAAPLIAAHTNFTDCEVDVGANCSFGVIVTGSRPLGIQWYHFMADSSGAPIGPGLAVTNGTNATLTFRNVQPEQEGYYRIVATNRLGIDSSERLVEYLMLNVRGFGNILP